VSITYSGFILKLFMTKNAFNLAHIK